jgi:hypothetical protein
MKCLNDSKDFEKISLVRLRRSYQAFCIWGDDHEVAKGNLDHVLMQSKDLWRIVLDSLAALGRVLYKSRWAVQFACLQLTDSQGSSIISETLMSTCLRLTCINPILRFYWTSPNALSRKLIPMKRILRRM